jgi:hypothetical protein
MKVSRSVFARSMPAAAALAASGRWSPFTPDVGVAAQQPALNELVPN